VTPQQFLTEVVEPNVAECRQRPTDLRAVCNAAMTMDALLGIVWATNHPGQRGDEAYKESVAQSSACFRVVRDLAYALKHGELTGTAPRLVRTPAGLLEDDRRWNDDHVWDDSEIMSDQIIVVQTPQTACRAGMLLERALRAARCASLGEAIPTDTLEEVAN